MMNHSKRAIDNKQIAAMMKEVNCSAIQYKRHIVIRFLAVVVRRRRGCDTTTPNKFN